MKTYILNKRESKIEVYETVYIPEGKRPTFYGGSTLCAYRGSIPTYYPAFHRNHNQVENVLRGNRENTPYYGNRSGDNFQVIEKPNLKSFLKYCN